MTPGPPVVAVIGASADRRKFGNKALRALKARGYRVVPINPTAAEIEGERAYKSVLEYPGPIDEATLYVPPSIGVRLMDDIARKGIRRIWLNPGADADEVVARARSLGLTPTIACTIIAAGEIPDTY
jgi:predicted CoA-binding protein